MNIAGERLSLKFIGGLYVEARNASTVCIAKAKSEYYQEIVQLVTSRCSGLIRYLGTEKKAIYPEFESIENGCSKFAHFNKKVLL